jgi:hypothetical protein
MPADIKKIDLDDLETIASVIERYPDTPAGWLLARMPIERRRVLNLIRKHETWLSNRLGRCVSYSPASYAASGSGPFGRYSSARARRHAATFYVAR